MALDYFWDAMLVRLSAVLRLKLKGSWVSVVGREGGGGAAAGMWVQKRGRRMTWEILYSLISATLTMSLLQSCTKGIENRW